MGESLGIDIDGHEVSTVGVNRNKSNFNVTINRIEVQSDDPDRFVDPFQ